MTDRKLLVIPVTQGVVSFATDAWVSVDGMNIERTRIVGRQPERNEFVMVLDIQDLVDAIRDGDDDMIDVEIGGMVLSKSPKAIVVKLDRGETISLPKRYVEAELDEYIKEARLPRWLAVDRGL